MRIGSVACVLVQLLPVRHRRTRNVQAQIAILRDEFINAVAIAVGVQKHRLPLLVRVSAITPKLDRHFDASRSDASGNVPRHRHEAAAGLIDAIAHRRKLPLLVGLAVPA